MSWLESICFVAVSAIAFSNVSASTGPVRPERQADKMIDSFESPSPVYRTSIRGKTKPTITSRAGYAKEGSRSLLVQLEPTGDEKGRNSVNLRWLFKPVADWSAYDGLMMWYQAQDTTPPGLTVVVVEASGAHYWQKIQPLPRMAGKWQRIDLPQDAWTWSWEGPKDADKHLDLAQIKVLQIEARAATGVPVVFALDGIGLFNKPPPYMGPTLQLACTKDGYIRTPGQSYTLVARVEDLPPGNKATVRLHGVDYWGKGRLDKELTFRGRPSEEQPANRYIRFSVDGPNYVDVRATLHVDDKLVYRAEKSFATIAPQQPEDQVANSNSIFGTWVGGGPWRIGAKWTRTYCRGSDVKQIGDTYQFRDNPPGQYHPKADPRLSYTFYFSAMPKWLSSEPERTDWQKWSPTSWPEYARFIQWVVRGAQAGGFTHYEVWNEPVPYAYWMGSIESVVKLHEVTYKAIKKVQPDAVVLGPCPYTFLWDFLEKYFEFGGAKWIDAVVIHAYSENPDIGFAANLQRLKKMMVKYGLGDRDIYITELGYTTPKVTEHEQAQFMVRAYMYAWSEGVRLLTWHMLWDYSGQGDPGYAILRHDHTPRPAYAAYATMTRLLERAKYVGPVAGLAPTQRGFRFRKRGRTIRVLWDTEGESSLRLKDIEAAHVTDLMGGSRPLEPVNNCITVPLGRDPIYIVSDEPQKK